MKLRGVFSRQVSRTLQRPTCATFEFFFRRRIFRDGAFPGSRPSAFNRRKQRQSSEINLETRTPENAVSEVLGVAQLSDRRT